MTTMTETTTQPVANGIAGTVKNVAPHALATVASLVFLDSLRYKFTNAPETQTIFGKLNDWAASLGADGLFAQTGLFSQYTIGTAELIASALLLIGILPAFRRLQALGALIAVAVMTGAISFHLFTPLGIDPNNDGGGLFFMACVVWIGSLTMLFLRRKELFSLLGDLRRALVPDRS
ncbi:MAG: DoxX family protein [Pseudomonadota bacterium]